jgi:NAD(P)-dependent dehydrogenase (short-subunit alcohol dehydrogenase family)
LENEFGAVGVTVNAYCPGVVGTEMWVWIDWRMAEITGAEIGANYKKFIGGIALGRRSVRRTSRRSFPTWPGRTPIT